jgi:hypothetical protein
VVQKPKWRLVHIEDVPFFAVQANKQRMSRQEKCQRLPGNGGWRSGCLVGSHMVNVCEHLQPTSCHQEFGIALFVSEFRANELLCLLHDLSDGDGHPLLAFLEQPSMELDLHSFKLANRTSVQAQAQLLLSTFAFSLS